jgi:hypothetical protein
MGHVYFTGAIRGVVDWGQGVLSEGVIPDRSITVVAFNADGTPQWAGTSAPSPWFATAQSIAATAEPGAIHFIGHAASEFTFDGHVVGADMAQTAVVGRIDGITTSITPQPGMVGMQAWPNPATDVLHVEVEATAVQPAELLNSAGQLVRSLPLQPGRNSIAIGDLPSGLYLLRTAEGEAVRVVKE